MPNVFKIGRSLTRKYCLTQNASKIPFEKPLMLSKPPSIHMNLEELASISSRKKNKEVLTISENTSNKEDS